MKARPLAISTTLIVFGCAGFAIWYFYLREGRVDFDQLGGTILVYEIVPDPDKGAAPADLAERMAETLQRRLDPTERGFAVVKPVGKDRVEIRITRTDEKQGAIDSIKDLIVMVGHLEFLILANSKDDTPAMNLAKTMFNGDEDGALREEIPALQEKGLPPPGPRDPGSKELKVFRIKLPKEQQCLVTYRWVELGPRELRLLDLDNEAETDPSRNETSLQAKKWRDQATQLKIRFGTIERLLMQGAYFHSRECKDKNLTDDERKKKAVEYFVLARDPEIDPKADEKLPITQRRTRTIDSRFFTSASPAKQDSGGQREPGWQAPWYVKFSLNAEGTELVRTLTKKNVPNSNDPVADVPRRHLAIILDGRVISAPTISMEIGNRGEISGSFTESEARNLAAVLGGGVLPAKLKPHPLSETEVPPKSN